MTGFNMDDYVDVAQRIAEFNEKYPEGSLQSRLTYHEDPAGWFCEAQAYRSPTDERPGVGHAFEPVPGKTPYTKDSEAMNAETSAWGRAIVALGFQTKKVASKQEVEARKGAVAEKYRDDPHGLQASRADAIPADQIEFTFGKHKGKRINEIPRDYLEWWLTSDSAKADRNQELRAAVELRLGLAEVIAAGASDDEDIPF